MAQFHSAIPLFIPLAVLVAPAYAVEYLTVEQAQAQLFAGARVFVQHDVTLSDEQRDAIKERAGVRQRSAKQAVWSAQREGESLGWFIADEVIGKHEFITYAVAISPQGSVLGIEIMSYRETHGGQVRDADWRNEFAGKTLADPLKLGKDIPNISGATLSCRNVTDGVKRLLVLHDLVLRGG
jgi:Na+-translocating ferredoxin:NAD+ oxidoreductase RnfG subunit